MSVDDIADVLRTAGFARLGTSITSADATDADDHGFDQLILAVSRKFRGLSVRREHLAVIAAALTVACVVPYLRDIRRGTTRPQRASWFVFATLAAVAAISQGLGEGGPGTWLAAGSALGFGAVFVASIPRGVGGFGAADRVALTIAAAGTAASLLVGRPIVALLGVVIAELSAVGLTAKKALGDPRSETGSTWIIDGLAGLLSIAAVDHVTTTTLLYPVHHTVANGAVVVAMAIGHRRSTWYCTNA